MQEKLAALSDSALCAYKTTMEPHDGLGDGEAESVSTGLPIARSIRAVEAVKDLREVLSFDSNPLIEHCDHVIAFCAVDA